MKVLGTVEFVEEGLTTERAGSVVNLQPGDKVVEGDVLRSTGNSKVIIPGNGTQAGTWVNLSAGGVAALSYDHAVGRAIVTKGPGCTTGVDAVSAADSSAVIVADESFVDAQSVVSQDDESNVGGLLLFGGLLGAAALLAGSDNDNASSSVPPRRVTNDPVEGIIDSVTDGGVIGVPIGGGGVIPIPIGDNGNGNGNNGNGLGNGGGVIPIPIGDNGNGNGNNGNGLGNGGGNGTGNEGNGNGPGIVIPVVDVISDGLGKTPLKDICKPLIGDASDDVGIIGIIKGIGKGCDDSLDPTPLKPIGDLVSDILGAGGKDNSPKDIDGLIGLVDEISDSVDRGLDNTPLEPIGSLVNTVVGSKETGDKEGFLCDTLLTIDNQLVSIGSKTPLNPVFDLCDNLLTGR